MITAKWIDHCIKAWEEYCETHYDEAGTFYPDGIPGSDSSSSGTRIHDASASDEGKLKD